MPSPTSGCQPGRKSPNSLGPAITGTRLGKVIAGTKGLGVARPQLLLPGGVSAAGSARFPRRCGAPARAVGIASCDLERTCPTRLREECLSPELLPSDMFYYRYSPTILKKHPLEKGEPEQGGCFAGARGCPVQAARARDSEQVWPGRPAAHGVFRQRPYPPSI